MKENPKFKGIKLDENDNPIEGSEFVAWYSRSIAVIAIIRDMNNKFALVEKRGPGCPDNVGKYCMPCGYLNWDETLQDAVIREVYEETGITISPNNVTFHSINDNIDNNRQNVSIRYNIWFTASEMIEFISQFNNSREDSSSRGGEANETAALMLVDKEFCCAHEDEFAFGHGKILAKLLA